MKKIRVASLSLSILVGAVFLSNKSWVDKMAEVKFDLGRNILQTAKGSGAPRYNTRNVQGLISYELVSPPLDIPFRYARSGFEISLMPVFAFTLYADEENKNDLAVETAAIQFETDGIKSHESAKMFVEALKLQFQSGRWKRHIHELCPAVSGRSSFLDESGEFEKILGCPLDPGYRLSMPDWLQLMGQTQQYTWTGDGVLAILTVGYSDDRRGINYSIGLEFEDHTIRIRRQEADRVRRLARGDANGHNSTAKEAKDIADTKVRLQDLEAMALKRGDSIVPR